MFTLNIPINSVSFGQTSIAILRELYARGIEPHIFPIGPVDLSAQKNDDSFNNKVRTGLNSALLKHNRNMLTVKLWHLSGGIESFGNSQVLITFYELDSPTKEEINACKNNTKVIFTSKYAQRTFEDCGVTNTAFIPLGFDSYSFYRKDKEYFKDRTTFNLAGKFEKRKNHPKIIASWVKKFGNNPKYSLQCAIYNPFMSPEENKALLPQLTGGQRIGNITFCGVMATNEDYNDYLNSADIMIGMSGGEGFGLPEFQSVALGKHAVIMNAHGYKSWATAENSVLVNPSGKMPAYDGKFFVQNTPFNQGNIYDFNEEEFIAGCEAAIERVGKNKVNEEGLKLQTTHSIKTVVDKLLDVINECEKK